ncbi:heme peroxidase [Mycena olivaceomarginata]|nr:heme peroxidase [Mycena olivaceomarginata]
MFGLTLLLAHVVASTAYVWPSPKLDALEAMRWDQGDTLNGFAPFVQPCSFFIFGDDEGTPTGRANGPDWIRTAYHDMATHNVEDGTGGLDASIRFQEEQSGPERGAPDSIPRRTSRLRREPNASGVPEPQQDLQSHIGSFARQGFTQTEMISLIACGRSFGGVEHKAFPDVVTDLKDPNDTLSVAHFDSTFDSLIIIATEYISGTTQNPLVVGANDTTNSDKRIFASDGNATIFAKSPELFASTCATLFARPLVSHSCSTGTRLKLSGLVRFWGLADDPTRTVQLLWDDRAAG